MHTYVHAETKLAKEVFRAHGKHFMKWSHYKYLIEHAYINTTENASEFYVLAIELFTTAG